MVIKALYGYDVAWKFMRIGEDLLGWYGYKIGIV